MWPSHNSVVTCLFQSPSNSTIVQTKLDTIASQQNSPCQGLQYAALSQQKKHFFMLLSFILLWEPFPPHPPLLLLPSLSTLSGESLCLLKASFCFPCHSRSLLF